MCAGHTVDNYKSDAVITALTIVSLSNLQWPLVDSCHSDTDICVVYLLLPSSSNCHIDLTKMLSFYSIRKTRLFESVRTASFSLWHLFVMCKNPLVRHFYCWFKIFEAEMLQKVWPSDWELLLICICWMCNCDALKLHFLFMEQLLLDALIFLSVFLKIYRS